MITNEKIFGERIYLRSLSILDATEKYASWLNDSEVNRHLETRKATIEDLQRYISEKNALENCLFLGIFLKENDSHIGNIKLEPIDYDKKRATFSIIIGEKSCWGQGIGTEATKILVNYGFEKLKLETVDLSVVVENKNAIRVYEKAGFFVKEIKKDYYNHDGKLSDGIVMEIKNDPQNLGNFTQLKDDILSKKSLKTGVNPAFVMRDDMFELLNGKTILITGGTGFIGRALIKELLKYGPARIRVLSRDEVKHHNLQEMFNYNDIIGNFVGDIRDYHRLLKASKGADIIIHAAALKRVDMIEYNVEEAIMTNIIGSLNLVRAAIENNVEKVIFISTDKACSPVNTYGSCKFVSERIVTESNYSKGPSRTAFVCVRYGNVLESTGSVIPFFTEKIKKGEALPLTDERMTRFAITSEQAVNLIFNAIKYGVGGEVFVPRIASHSVVDLIDVLKEKYNSDVPVKRVGIRPGEKIHELMINETEMPRTIEFRDLYIINPCISNPWMRNKICLYAPEAKSVDFEKMREYSSKDWVVPKEELKRFLTENKII